MDGADWVIDCSGDVYQQAEDPEAEGGEHGEGDGEMVKSMKKKYNQDNKYTSKHQSKQYSESL